MGFRDARKTVLDCLNQGHILYDQRNSIDIKNLLSTGAVSLSDITDVIVKSRGTDYSSSPHHFDNNIEVHIIKTTIKTIDWYVKWYFVEPNCVFISVHH